MPLDSKSSCPSELNGRKFGSMLPNISNFSSQYSDKLVERHAAQLQHDTQGCTLKELPIGSTVGYCDHANNQFNVGIVSERNGRSYVVCTENGRKISQNHMYLRQTNVPCVQKPVNYANSKHVPIPPTPDNTKFKQPNKAKLLGKEINVRKSKNSGDVYRTCSGCISKPAA